MDYRLDKNYKRSTSTQGFPLRGGTGGGHSTMEVIPPLVRSVPPLLVPPLLGPCPPPTEEFFPAARATYMLTIV